MIVELSHKQRWQSICELLAKNSNVTVVKFTSYFFLQRQENQSETAAEQAAIQWICVEGLEGSGMLTCFAGVELDSTMLTDGTVGVLRLDEVRRELGEELELRVV